MKLLNTRDDCDWRSQRTRIEWRGSRRRSPAATSERMSRSNLCVGVGVGVGVDVNVDCLRSRCRRSQLGNLDGDP